MFPFVSRTHLRIELVDLKVAEADILPRLKLVLQEEKASEIAETANGLKFFIPMYWAVLRSHSDISSPAWLIDHGEMTLDREENAWHVRLELSHMRWLAFAAPFVVGLAAVLVYERAWLPWGFLTPLFLVGVSFWPKVGDTFMKTRLRTALCGPE